jgi:hypothetical protein
MHPIWKIKLFKKLENNKAECIECKKIYTISDGSLKSLKDHLGREHKGTEYEIQYNDLMASSGKTKGEGTSKTKGQSQIDTFVMRSSGLFLFNLAYYFNWAIYCLFIRYIDNSGQKSDQFNLL